MRELTAIVENENQAWARQMKDLLLDIKAAVDKQKENSKTQLELEQLMDFESRYSRIMAKRHSVITKNQIQRGVLLMDTPWYLIEPARSMLFGLPLVFLGFIVLLMGASMVLVIRKIRRD
ncbi:MAG: hypothetical protein AB1447_13970 [Bacillota bacterium]